MKENGILISCFTRFRGIRLEYIWYGLPEDKQSEQHY